MILKPHFALILFFLFSGTLFGVEPDIEISSGPKLSISTNKPFSITITVDQDFGYFSTNNSKYYDFPKGNKIIAISNTTSLKYYGHNGLQKTMTYSVKYSFDFASPKLTVYGSPDSLELANDSLSLAGNVNDANGVLAVYYRLNGGTWNKATGKTYWDIKVSGLSNSNTMEIYAVDIAGNQSSTNTVEISLIDPDLTAQVHIRDFKIRDDIYTLYENSTLIGVISNSNYTKVWNVVPSKTSYFILIRNRDTADVVYQKVDLKKGESVSFSYQALGAVKIESVENKSLNKDYVIFIDGEKYVEGDVVTGLDVTVPHTAQLSCTRRRCTVLDETEFYVSDGATNTITLRQPEERKIFLKMFGLYGSYGNLGFELFLTRKFWFGLNGGVSFAQATNQTLSFTATPSFELGVLLLGDRTGYAQLGVGVGFGAHIPIETSPSVEPFGLVFVQLEWRFLFGRASAAFYPQSEEWVAFLPAVGFKF